MARRIHVILTCPALGADLLVTKLDIFEAISTPTRAVLQAVSDEDIDGDAAVLAPARVVVLHDDEPARTFHLVVTGFRFDGIHRGNRRRYVIELDHELRLLSLRQDVRMFQEKHAAEIVAEVLRGGGVPADHASFSLHRIPSRRTYTVQYRETDLAFVSRLLEFEGIHYTIDHHEDAPCIVFADTQEAFGPIAGDTIVQLLDDDAHGIGVLEFELESRATAERVTLKDYSFLSPDFDLTASFSLNNAPAGDLFDYPAGYTTPADGDALRRIRLEEVLAGRTVGHGVGEVIAFRAGAWFELEGPTRGALAGRHLLRTVAHHIVVHPEESDGEPSYENRFTCIPLATRYRPPRATPRPHVRGSHSVVVTGPAGSEIHTDEYGRLKGHFFWDRVGAEDDRSSCWMRQTQLPLGGSMALARVGWEMAVAYVHGDPDRPVAVARLYNAEKTPPYALPAGKTRTALQTASSPASGKSNEIRMEDGAAGMEFFVNAAKDLSNETRNNKAEKVGANATLTVGADASETIGASQKVTIGASETTSVGANAALTIGAARTKSVGGTETASVSGNITTVVAGGDIELTGGSHTTLAALGVSRTSVGAHALTVGGSMVSAAGLGCAVAVGGAKAETIGGVKLTLSGAAVAESVLGALATTVGGACVHAAGAHRQGATKGASALTVGGVVCANAAGKVMLKAKKVSITVAGLVNLLGGGGVVNMTPGSTTFVGLVTLDASGGIKVTGNPNLIG